MSQSFEYTCSQGHGIKSLKPLDNQEQINFLCFYCKPPGPERQKAAWRQVYNEMPIVKTIENEIERMDTELNNYASPNIDTFTIQKDHEALKSLIGKLLEGEGYEVDYEVTLPDLKFRWRADVVGYKDDKIHTVVEVGKLSHSAKLSVLESIYPRFIWVPYVPILDVEKLLSLSDGLGKIPEIIIEVRQQLETLKGTFKTTVRDVVAANSEVIRQQTIKLAEIRREREETYWKYQKLHHDMITMLNSIIGEFERAKDD